MIVRLAILLLLMGLGIAQAQAAEYIGEKECFACHKNQKRSYMGNKHGFTFENNARGDLQARGCESCHGPGSEHAKVVGEDGYKGPMMIENFKSAEATKQCVACHQGSARIHWAGSQHEASGVTCTNCHKMHTNEPMVNVSVCGTCHAQQRAQVQRSAHMPVREGAMSCMSCHNPHGGTGPSGLKRASINEVCYECHTEKRGPMLREHAPVRENCVNCHDPHGNSNPTMLKMRPPYLCQSCHAINFHPANLYDGSSSGLAGSDRRLIGKGCVNCHSQIHGSNHPSGQHFQR